jgi:dihydrolipoamide dehydrogenase
MSESRTYDVVVIGAGAVGENVADRASRTGLSVLVVEEELVGGECSYWACMPSKALLRPGAALAAARGVGGAAQAVTGPLDAVAVLARRDSFASHWDDAGQLRWLEGAGLTLLRGHARLTGVRTVVVETDDGDVPVDARHAVVVATGSEPVVPDVPGLAEAQPWTSREATSAQQAPGRLVVLGGGVVGVEMATAYRDLGGEVTLVVRGSRVLTAAEPFAGDAVGRALADLGVDVRYGVEATAVRRGEDVTVELSDGSVVTADEVLVATGRRPRTDGLGLETVGLGDGALEVDDQLRVTAVEGDWLYAVGDVTGRTATTHQAQVRRARCGGPDRGTLRSGHARRGALRTALGRRGPGRADPGRVHAARSRLGRSHGGAGAGGRCGRACRRRRPVLGCRSVPARG